MLVSFKEEQHHFIDLQHQDKQHSKLQELLSIENILHQRQM